MERESPVGVLCDGFSSPGAVAPRWESVADALGRAEVYWISSVRPDGRPHVTPILGIWSADSFVFCTGPDERKAANLVGNPSCAVTTGTNVLDGLDLVVEGEVVALREAPDLAALADGLVAKYGQWFAEPDGTWAGLAAAIRTEGVLVFRLLPRRVLAFGKGDVFSQSAWEFPPGAGDAR